MSRGVILLGLELGVAGGRMVVGMGMGGGVGDVLGCKGGVGAPRAIGSSRPEGWWTSRPAEATTRVDLSASALQAGAQHHNQEQEYHMYDVNRVGGLA